MHSISGITDVFANTPPPATECMTGNEVYEMVSNPTVLILEDNDIVTDFLQSVCQAYGFRALAARTPTRAVEHCQRERNSIRVLIADVRIGSFDGFATAQTLIKMCPGMKVVFTSGYPYDHLVSTGRLPANLKTGMFLQKPFLPSDILSALKSVQPIS